MVRAAVILGTTRPGRKATAVAEWVLANAVHRDDAVFELVDIADYDLPLLDEPLPAGAGQYTRAHTRDWAARIATFDGFVFVTPEYNRSIPGSLKNALDFLFAEWNDKAAGFVSYGLVGGMRAVEQLRQMLGELKVADVRASVALTLADDFEARTTFRPREDQVRALEMMLDDLVDWAGALSALRERRPTGQPARDGSRRVLVLGRSAEVQREIRHQLDDQAPGIELQASTEVEDATDRFDARDFELIVLGRGIVGPLSNRLRREFMRRNPHVDLLDAWGPAAARQIITAVRSHSSPQLNGDASSSRRRD